MRSFDRMQAQKIRKPKKDEEEAEEIAEQIEELAQDEDFVYATLGRHHAWNNKGERRRATRPGRRRECGKEDGARRKEG